MIDDYTRTKQPGDDWSTRPSFTALIDDPEKRGYAPWAHRRIREYYTKYIHYEYCPSGDENTNTRATVVHASYWSNEEWCTWDPDSTAFNWFKDYVQTNHGWV